MRPARLLPVVLLLAVLAGVLFACTGCGREPGRVTQAPVGAFTLVAEAFDPGAPVPRAHAHPDEGENRSPALAWRDVPQWAAEVAVVVDDPDAPGPEPFVHWLVWGLRADLGALPEGLSSMAKRPATYAAVREGRNGFGEVGWTGPLPPAGHGPHRYRFTAYALRARLDLPAGASKLELLDAMAGSVIGTAELVGTYERAVR